MKIMKATRLEIEDAVARTSAIFANNIYAQRIERITVKANTFQVALRPKRTKPTKEELEDGRDVAPGAKFSTNPWGNRRRVSACCWHVFGIFFEQLPESAIIRVSGRLVDPEKWVDFNVGSQMYPMWASEQCECPEHEDFIYRINRVPLDLRCF